MKISIIIPTLNESEHISNLLNFLYANANNNVNEIIVIDGGSSDNTVELAKKNGVIVYTSSQKGRAAQMNFGANKATGDILYFVHADSVPPPTYSFDVINTVKNDFQLGCYPFQFRSKKWLLKFNSWLTQFDKMCFRGGDQTLFITRDLFNKINGYDTNFVIMEEYDLIKRARKLAKFTIIKTGAVSVSARKYDLNSYWRITIANFIAFTMFNIGKDPEKILSTYLSIIQHPTES